MKFGNGQFVNSAMYKGQNIQERLVDFAVTVVRLCEAMPATVAGRHVAGQLLRSGTAPAAHYAEARGAESRRDFVHKLRIALKELNESAVWIQVAQRSGLAAEAAAETALTECRELSRILNASVRTAANAAGGHVHEPETEWTIPPLLEDAPVEP